MSRRFCSKVYTRSFKNEIHDDDVCPLLSKASQISPKIKVLAWEWMSGCLCLGFCSKSFNRFFMSVSAWCLAQNLITASICLFASAKDLKYPKYHWLQAVLVSLLWDLLKINQTHDERFNVFLPLPRTSNIQNSSYSNICVFLCSKICSKSSKIMNQTLRCLFASAEDLKYSKVRWRIPMCVSLLQVLQNHSQETKCLFAPAEDLEYSKVYLWRDMSVSRLWDSAQILQFFLREPNVCSSLLWNSSSFK